jgi:hypothetical protein
MTSAIEDAGRVATLARTQSFTDDKGNRFIFPSMIIYPDDEKSMAAHDVTLKAMTLSIALRADLDNDWLEFDPEHFPHVSTIAGHHNFMHGGATVYLFAGPEFDAALASATTS